MEFIEKEFLLEKNRVILSNVRHFNNLLMQSLSIRNAPGELKILMLNLNIKINRVGIIIYSPKSKIYNKNVCG